MFKLRTKGYYRGCLIEEKHESSRHMSELMVKMEAEQGQGSGNRDVMVKRSPR